MSESDRVTRAIRSVNLAAWLTGRKRPATVAEIEARYGVSRRTVYRMLEDLRAAGVLVEDDGRYLARTTRAVKGRSKARDGR